MTPGLTIYREISGGSAGLIAWLEARNQLWNIEDKKGNEHLFIENDIPRDADITPMIVRDTVGFALFQENGDMVGRFSSLERAEKAASSAKIVITAEVEDVEPDLAALDEEPDED